MLVKFKRSNQNGRKAGGCGAGGGGAAKRRDRDSAPLAASGDKWQPSESGCAVAAVGPCLIMYHWLAGGSLDAGK